MTACDTDSDVGGGDGEGEEPLLQGELWHKNTGELSDEPMQVSLSEGAPQSMMLAPTVQKMKKEESRGPQQTSMNPFNCPETRSMMPQMQLILRKPLMHTPLMMPQIQLVLMTPPKQLVLMIPQMLPQLTMLQVCLVPTMLR